MGIGADLHVEYKQVQQHCYCHCIPWWESPLSTMLREAGISEQAADLDKRGVFYGVGFNVELLVFVQPTRMAVDADLPLWSLPPWF